MIKIEGLSKFFRTEEVETIALNGVSMEVKDGEFVAIMGPSGCGKSTLLNILGLLDNPTSGDYYLAGKEVGHLKEKERTQVRKAIARAVVSNPKIILADEPTGNLDSKNGAEVMQLLTELNKEGTTIVMVTHSKHDASFAHRVINLFDGSIVSSISEFI